ncbi:MAG: hypothetical protein II563_08485 [Treponema sp.]|nr:hypothetical protein [Treponema sp.]MBQ2552865.1 hypothetical protein [Treponema sp.]
MSDQIQDEERMQSAELNKTRLIKFATAGGVILVLLGLLFLFVFLSRQSWKDGISRQIENVLSKNGLEYEIAEADSIRSMAGTNVVSFALSDGVNHAAAVKMMTIYGPVPAVFIYNAENDRASFVDFAEPLSIAGDAVLDYAKNSQIPYWENRIPKIMKTAGDPHASFKEETK